jgi:hypothetical protein
MKMSNKVAAGNSCIQCHAPVPKKTPCCPCCCILLEWWQWMSGWHIQGARWWKDGPPVREHLNPATFDDALAFVRRIWGHRGKIEVTTGIFNKKTAGYVDDNRVFHEVEWSSHWAGLIENLKPLSVSREAANSESGPASVTPVSREAANFS